MWIRMTLGCGLLVIPYYMTYYGLIPGLFALIFAAFLNYITFRFIFEASDELKCDSFEGLIKQLVGVGKIKRK